MGGLFGVVSRVDCVQDLFYGTDYHSHLGTRRGGLATLDDQGFHRHIHNIENSQFRSKFETDVHTLRGRIGIGSISDTEPQPLIIASHLGTYAIATVGRINNSEPLVSGVFHRGCSHFGELSGAGINATELMAALINEGATFEEGIRAAQRAIDGSCTLLLLTPQGVYAARDRFGRTPLVVGEKEGALCATVETCALPNLGYRICRELGPGEIVRLTPEGLEQKGEAGDRLRVCAFLWIYFGYPASTYEGQNVEVVRNRSGALLALRDDVEVDLVAGVPDSGIAHAIGYANQSRTPYGRPFVKYTPTWPRSFMPQAQAARDLVARMKLIPVREMIQGKRLLFCEDSIVRGTQLRETIQRVFDCGATEVHMRPACPPLIHNCRFLNFSVSRSELALAGRRAIRELEDRDDAPLERYAETDSERQRTMIERVRNRLNVTSLRYQTMPDMIEAIGLPKDRVCTYCWDGQG